METSVSFFGTYLASQTGSRPSSTTIAAALSDLGCSVRMTSRRGTPITRAIDSIWTASTTSPDIAVLDVYSSRVLLITNLVARILAWRRIPFISVLRGGALLEKFKDVDRLLQPILRRSSKVVSPSRYLCAGFRKHGYEVTCVPNALITDAFPYHQRNHLGSPVRLLWVRAFADIYRPIWPVEIVSGLIGRGIEAKLTMIGPDKGLLDSVKAKAIELNVSEHIEFIGPVPNQELFHYYHAHDFLLNTTRYESFGVALIEAAASGLPIVSAAVGEVRHSWQDEEDIFMVAGDTSHEFIERIAGLCLSDDDASRYRGVSRAAREKVSHFALENVVPAWQDMIASICDGRSA